MGISDTRLDDSVQSSEIQIENYDLICSDKNRHGSGVTCFMKNDLSYNTRSFLSSEIKNIFIEIFYHIQSLLLWVLYIIHRANIVLLKQLLNIFQRLKQTIQKYIL